MKDRQKILIRKIGFVLTLMLIVSVLNGCAVRNKDEILRDARFAVSEAQENPETEKYAPVDLVDAEKTLQQAERAGSEKEMKYQAYLAQRKAQIAMAKAREKSAARQREKLLDEREALLKELRKLEAGSALAQAQLAREELAAEQARRMQLEQEAEQKAMEARMAREKLERLQQQLQDLEARQTERGLVLTLGDILFETDKSELVTGSGAKLDKVVKVLNEFPDRQVLIEGHTDSRGSFEYNQQLSEARANSVRDALIDKGISPERVSAKGLSESQPVASNDTAIGRQQNRRVEIIIPNEPGE